MLQKGPGCVGCELEHKGTSFSRPEGSGTRNIVIVGEALGENEAIEGLPFRPKAPALHESTGICGVRLLPQQAAMTKRGRR